MSNNEEILRSIDFTKVAIQDMEFKVNRGTVPILHHISDIIPKVSPEYGLHLEIENERKTNSEIIKLNKQVIGIVAPKRAMKELELSELQEKYVELREPIVSDLVRNALGSIERLTPIQHIAILPLIQGLDALLQSNSGTGKTYAMSIGCLYHFDPSDPSLQHIYITSTHEIADQIHRTVSKFAPGNANIQLCIGQKPGKPTGGFVDRNATRREPRAAFIQRMQNAQILVCTMGKLYDCMVNMKILDVSNLKTICVDEFDNILDPTASRSDNTLSTLTQIKSIFEKIPASTQRTFFSATIANALGNALKCFRQGYGVPFLALKEKDDIFLEGIKQYYIEIDGLRDENYAKMIDLIDILQQTRLTQCIVFANHVDTVEKISDTIKKETAINAEAIHAGLSDKERRSIVDRFINGDIKILVATDVLARGFDAQHVNLVINFDMPQVFETYVHRIGRAGRFGRKGSAISFISSTAREMDKVREINIQSPKSQMMNLMDFDITRII